MRTSRSLSLLLLVAAATGGTAFWRWPRIGPALEAGSPLLEAAWPVLVIAVGGLLLLHIHAVTRLAGLADGASEDGGAPSPRKRPEPEREKPRASRPSRGTAKAPSTGLRPRAVERSPAAGTSKASEEPEKVEEFLKVVLDDADAEDVSFLPPYASDEPDDPSLLGPYAADEGPEASFGIGDGEDEPESEADRDAPEPASAGAGGGGPAEAESYRNVPIPRHFALGTVAIIKQTLTPAEVAQVLVEQRKRPREKFGELAVEMGLLSQAELEELLVAQQQGLFTDEEIRQARGRIKSFRELEAAASAE